MKRFFAVCCIFLLLFTLLPIETFAVSAGSAVVMDAASGRILFAQNADKKRGMASTTKIMTAITALENADINKLVTISPTASGVEGSSMYLAKGEKLTLEALLYGLMLVSGNDAATAIAETVSGSVEEFAKLMNKKAAEIGAVNSNFTNPHGLSDPDHYTTAEDLAKITAYALSNSKFREIVSQKNKKLPQNEGGYPRTLVNHNKFLNMYDGCIGVKTGFTKATGRCLVTAVERNGMTFICVTLNAPDDWNDHSALYNTAFSEFSPYPIKQSGEKIIAADVKQGVAKDVTLVTQNDIYIPIKQGEESLINITPQAYEDLTAPIKKGDILGVLNVSVGDTVCGSFPLVADCDIELKKVIFKASSLDFATTFKKVFYAWITCFQ